MKKNILLIALILMITGGSFVLKAESDKKIGFEASFGIFKPRFNDVNIKAGSIANHVTQYSSFFGANVSTVSEPDEMSGMMMPLNLAVTYRLNEKIKIKGGFEFASKSMNTSADYSADISSVTHTFTHDFDNKVSYFMPWVGIETKLEKISLFANLGINMAKFKHTSAGVHAFGSERTTLDENIDVSGSGIAIVIGAKYSFELSESFSAFIKLEYFYSKVSSFNGDNLITSNGTSRTETGDLWVYKVNPYNIGTFGTFGVSETEPVHGWASEARKFELDFSSLRIMLGVSF